ncbi:MAG: hypothetical protein ABI779_23790 [Acidobacteriota bacterium]
MNLSRDSMLGLQRHFLGALSGQARTWLEPLPLPPLVVLGDALRPWAEGSMLDFGSVESPGEERRRVRVCNRGPEPLEVRLADPPAWLAAHWLECGGDSVTLASGGAGAVLEALVVHDAECEFRGSLRLVAGDQIFDLRVSLTARRSHPVARFDFNGSPSAEPFDFGNGERPYRLAVANASSVPLIVTFADLPAWLTFEVDGRRRGGPIEGTFFERTAPFSVTIRPQTVGPHAGVLRVRTNDPRPALQNIELPFAAFVTAAKPFVVALPPSRVRVRTDQSRTVEARLENWGRSPARLSKETIPRFLAVTHCPEVPAAHEGQPGSAALSVRIVPANLALGPHTLRLSLRIEGGDPATVDVPVPIEVTRGRTSAFRPLTVAILFALLLVALLLVIARGPS